MHEWWAPCRSAVLQGNKLSVNFHLVFPELNLSLDRLIEQNLDGEGKLWHRCLNCGKMMKQKDKLRRHVEVHMGWSLPCPICGEVCKTRNGLSHHHARVHRGQM